MGIQVETTKSVTKQTPTPTPKQVTTAHIQGFRYTRGPDVTTYRPSVPHDLRPVYRHTSTSRPKFTYAKPTVNAERVSTAGPAKARQTEAPSAPSVRYTTSAPVTPMRVTEFNPFFARQAALKQHEDKGNFKPPALTESDYSGWKALNAGPQEGKGDANPVVSYVKENTPEIIIRSPSSSDSDDIGEVITGTKFSERLGAPAAKTGSQMVQFTSKLNVETPGVVRSYWIDPPSLAK